MARIMPSAWDEGKCRLVSQREQDARDEVVFNFQSGTYEKIFFVSYGPQGII
jgi:hypothetical protein